MDAIEKMLIAVKTIAVAAASFPKQIVFDCEDMPPPYLGIGGTAPGVVTGPAKSPGGIQNSGDARTRPQPNPRSKGSERT